MRKHRYLIPIVIFLAGVVASNIVLAGKSRAIRHMLDEAGWKGRPVVMIKSEYAGIPGLFFISLDSKPVFVPWRNLGRIAREFHFSKSGSLLLLTAEELSFGLQGWIVGLPDIRFRQLRPDYVRYQSDQVVSPGYAGQYILTTDLYHYTITDLITGEMTRAAYASPPPWEESGELDHLLIRRNFRLSPDATAIVASQRYSRDFDSVVTYDIPAEVWSEPFRTRLPYRGGIGYHADILGIDWFQWGSGLQTDFIDGHSGELIHNVQDVYNPVFGERWVAAATANPVSDVEDLIFFDMQDNWREYRIDAGFIYILGIAIYEPPPRGVEEMLEMRRHE